MVGVYPHDSGGPDGGNGGHGGNCVDWGGHDLETGIFWYSYRPEQQGCALDAADIVKARATVRVSPENTTTKYPEYDKIWSDDRLEVPRSGQRARRVGRKASPPEEVLRRHPPHSESRRTARDFLAGRRYCFTAGAERAPPH